MKQFDTVEKALDELKQGHLILVTDDEDRENEGDLICAASFATTENVNFMATHAKGLICMPMSAEICRKLQFPQMVTLENLTALREIALRRCADRVNLLTESARVQSRGDYHTDDDVDDIVDEMSAIRDEYCKYL